MNVTEPKLENRTERHYVGIRNRVPMQELPNVIPQSIGEVAAWLGQQGIQPDGPPIMRLHACPAVPGPSALVDVAVGWPVPRALIGDGRIVADALPAGRYASLIYTGVENGVPGNAVLMDWAKAQGIEWDSWDDEAGDGEAFAGRVEYMLDGPDDDPNPSNWKTEVAVKLADK